MSSQSCANVSHLTMTPTLQGCIVFFPFHSYYCHTQHHVTHIMEIQSKFPFADLDQKATSVEISSWDSARPPESTSGTLHSNEAQRDNVKTLSRQNLTSCSVASYLDPSRVTEEWRRGLTEQSEQAPACVSVLSERRDGKAAHRTLHNVCLILASTGQKQKKMFATLKTWV